MLSVLYTSWATADTRVDVHVASEHGGPTYFDPSGTEQRYNETNFGIGITQSIVPGMSWKVGAYNNSFNNVSVYGALSLHTSRSRLVSGGIDIGAATGYKDTTSAITHAISILAIPYIALNFGRVSMNIGYAPAPSEESHSLTTLSFSYKL